MEKLVFTTEDNQESEFYIIANTRVAGVNYILVTDSDDEDDEDAQAFILKDISSDDDPDGNYVMVEDDDEFDAVAQVLKDDLEDIDLE